MVEKPTCACGKPIRDNAYLCMKCTDRLEQDLGDVPALFGELATTKYGLSRTGDGHIGVTSRNAERALPFNDQPVERARELQAALRGAVEVVVLERGAGNPRDMLPDLARFLLLHLHWLRRREQAPEIHRSISYAVNRLRGSVEGRRPERRNWGRCGSVDYLDNGEPDPTCAPCPAEVRAWPNARRAICEACGTVHELNQERQDWLLEQARGELMYAAQLSKAVTFLGKPVEDPTIRSWVRRGRLQPHVERDQHGRELFRVGDVLDLLQAEAERQATLAAKPARKRRAG